MDYIHLSRIVLTFILCLSFGWWATTAILRYQKQPTGVKTYQTSGDSNKEGILFPNLAICQWDFIGNNPILKKCGNGMTKFIDAIRHCLNGDSK